DEEQLTLEPTDGLVIAEYRLVQGDRTEAPAADDRRRYQACDGQPLGHRLPVPGPGATPSAESVSVFSISAIFSGGKRGRYSSPRSRHTCTCASTARARSESSPRPSSRYVVCAGKAKREPAAATMSMNRRYRSSAISRYWP